MTRDSIPGALRDLNWGAIGVFITIATMAAGLIAQWAVMNEERHNAQTRDVAQNGDIAELEQRIRDLENNRALEKQISDLSVAVTGRLATVETKIEALSRDVRRGR